LGLLVLAWFDGFFEVRDASEQLKTGSQKLEQNFSTVKSISMLTVGSHGLYDWLVTDQQFDLLQVCPEVVLGKYIAITSLDSGQLVPTDEEMADGWEARGKIAYSPKVQNIKSIPRDGWDEWYIFGNPTDLGTSHLHDNIFEVPQEPGHVSVFVNYCFALHQPELNDLATLFWEQMAWIFPESYVGDNDYLNFVTRNKALFSSVLHALKALE